MARWRCPPESWCGQACGALRGLWNAGGRQQLNGLRPGGFHRQPLLELQHLGNLLTNAHQGVERGHWALERSWPHRCHAHCAIACSDKASRSRPSSKAEPPIWAPSSKRSRLSAVTDLPEPDSPTRASFSPACRGKAHALHHGLATKRNAQVLHLQQGGGCGRDRFRHKLFVLAFRPWQLARLLFDFFVLGFHPALQVFDVFFGGSCSGAMPRWPSMARHALVVLHMLLGDGAPPSRLACCTLWLVISVAKFLAAMVSVGKKSAKRARLHDAVFVFHHLRGVATKQGLHRPWPECDQIQHRPHRVRRCFATAPFLIRAGGRVHRAWFASAYGLQSALACAFARQSSFGQRQWPACAGAVLGDQVTGIAGEHEVFDSTLGTTASKLRFS